MNFNVFMVSKNFYYLKLLHSKRHILRFLPKICFRVKTFRGVNPGKNREPHLLKINFLKYETEHTDQPFLNYGP